MIQKLNSKFDKLFPKLIIEDDNEEKEDKIQWIKQLNNKWIKKQ